MNLTAWKSKKVIKDLLLLKTEITKKITQRAQTKAQGTSKFKKNQEK